MPRAAEICSALFSHPSVAAGWSSGELEFWFVPQRLSPQGLLLSVPGLSRGKTPACLYKWPDFFFCLGLVDQCLSETSRHQMQRVSIKLILPWCSPPDPCAEVAECRHTFLQSSSVTQLCLCGAGAEAPLWLARCPGAFLPSFT